MRCTCCGLEKLGVGLLFDVRRMQIGGEGLWLWVVVWFCVEGAGSVWGALSWLSVACGTRCREFDEMAGEVLLEMSNVCAKWGKVRGENGNYICQWMLV